MKRFGLCIILILVLLLTACLDPQECTTCEGPVITGSEELHIPFGTTFDVVDYFTANDDLDGDLTNDLEIKTGYVDGLVEGDYAITISVTVSHNNQTKKHDLIHVNVALAEYPQGIDLSHLPGEQRALIMAQMEAYMLENMIGGVPLYRNATYYLYSTRFEMYSEVNSNVLGYGEAFSTLTEDDTTILINGSQGNADEYTFRDGYFYEPTTLNPYQSDTSETEEFLQLFNGELYGLYFNDEKTTYEFKPEHASQMPIAVDAVVVNHKEYATVWQIPVRDNIVWTFHPDTDVSSLDEGYAVLDAEDYIWTWRLALENEWFRAVSGGGDFVSMGIKNVQSYLDGSTSMEEIGIRLAEGQDNVIEIEFDEPIDVLNVLYMMTLNSKSPINKELYEYFGEEAYGLSPESVASSGAYYFSDWTPNEEIYFVKNNDFIYQDKIQYTGYHYLYLADEASWLEEFLNGNLEYVELTNTQALDYLNDERMFIGQNTASWGIQINGFGTEANRDEYISNYPDFGLSTIYVPEPILGYLEMKQALFYAIDRQELIDESGKLAVPNYTYFPDQYIVDSLTGHTVRTTSLGQAVREQYDFDGMDLSLMAVALFQEAVTKAIQDGYYAAGTEANPTIIAFDLSHSSSGNTAQQTYAVLLAEMLEEVLYDDVNHVGIEINVLDIAFPSSYSHYVYTASYDIALVGLSDYMPHHNNIAERYRDDNYSGFTFNWGIDTSTPNLVLEYTNYNGDTIKEIWSFNALCDALREEVFIEDGIIKTSWDQAEDLIHAYLSNLDLETEEVLDGSEFFENFTGGTLEEYKTLHNITEELEVYMMDTDENRYVFLLSLTEDGYEEYYVIKMYQDLQIAVEQFVHDSFSIGVTLDSMDGVIENDTDVINNEYLSSIGITNYQELFDAFEGINTDLVVFQKLTWSYGWSDVMAVIEIDGYYVGWYWY